MPHFMVNGELFFLDDGVEPDEFLPLNRVPVSDAEAGVYLLSLRDVAAEKAAVLTQARELRDKIFSRLNGIHQDLDWSARSGAITDAVATPQINGIMAAKEGLKGITTYSTVASAVTGEETTAALTARYAQLVTALYAVSPYACTAFNGLDV